jgi:hypothetical protein
MSKPRPPINTDYLKTGSQLRKQLQRLEHALLEARTRAATAEADKARAVRAAEDAWQFARLVGQPVRKYATR